MLKNMPNFVGCFMLSKVFASCFKDFERFHTSTKILNFVNALSLFFIQLKCMIPCHVYFLLINENTLSFRSEIILILQVQLT